MWPFISWSEVDISSTIAAFSALVACGALFWNIWWSYKKSKQESFTRIATNRMDWVRELREVCTAITVDFTTLRNHAQFDTNFFNEKENIPFLNRLYTNIAKADYLVNDSSDNDHASFSSALAKIRELAEVPYDSTETDDPSTQQLIQLEAAANTNFMESSVKILREEWRRIRKELGDSK